MGIMSLTIQELSELIVDQAKAKGFGIKAEEVDVAEKIALIHSEISEAYEAYRRKNIKGKDGLEEELGDAVQRIIHLCVVLDVDIEEAILKKVEHNKNRVWDWENLNEGKNKKSE